ncbi:hypothetical protein HUN08_15570 [Gordonia sp. X0973]|uniref:hypothetical protein n=1 Tax=Gordonia sp. X0973 TaxID=2742602 RepID=UPI000F51D1CB|nr:hypothetical protein [Gordonia sp. X0973]QKT08455.1 hypothetical protein HUN08_15570 [Gordonia sp. X0973]
MAKTREAVKSGGEERPIPKSWWVVAAVLAALIVVTGFLGFRYFRLQSVESARSSSLAAAKDYANTMFTYDPETVDAKITKSQGFLVDDARREFDEQVLQAKMSQNVKGNRIISKLSVADAGVVTNTRTTSTVLLFLNQSVTSSAEPKVRVDPSRVQFTMARHGGKWKINDIRIFTDDSLRNVVERQVKDPAPSFPAPAPAPN